MLARLRFLPVNHLTQACAQIHARSSQKPPPASSPSPVGRGRIAASAGRICRTRFIPLKAVKRPLRHRAFEAGLYFLQPERYKAAPVMTMTTRSQLAGKKLFLAVLLAVLTFNHSPPATASATLDDGLQAFQRGAFDEAAAK